MKSLLIIDTPKSCGDCPCIHDELWMCQADKEYREGEYSSVPLWCPLKPMPQKKETYKFKDLEDVKMIRLIENAQVVGWNDCIEELEK